MVSLDVASLFTKVPIDLALEIAHEHLEKDTLDMHTGLSVASLCLSSPYV